MSTNIGWFWPTPWQSWRLCAGYLLSSTGCPKEKFYLGRLSFEKKKLWIFTTGGEGGHPKILTFSQFFFACSNSSKSAIKFFCKGGRGIPWPIYFENLDNYQVNIDFLKSFLGFQGKIFLILHIMVFWSRIKKKSWGFTTFFFFEW